MPNSPRGFQQANWHAGGSSDFKIRGGRDGREIRLGTGHRSHIIILYLLRSSCCAQATALESRDYFYSSFLKGVTVTEVGNSVQVDTNSGRSEPRTGLH